MPELLHVIRPVNRHKVTFIDMMLITAIKSSPHTAPQKANDQAIHKYPEFTGRQWRFGHESDDGEEEKEEEEDDDDDDDDDEAVDVVITRGRLTMKQDGCS